MRRCRILALLLAGALFASCSYCGKKAPSAELTRFVPADIDAVAVVPDLRILADRLGIVSRLKIASFLAGTQGFNSADELIASLVNQAGVDIRSAEALAKAGVEPSRGLAVAQWADGSIYLVVAVRDPSLLERTVAGLARTRLGAAVADKKAEGGLTVTTYSTRPGAPPELGWVVHEGVALVGAGPAVPRLAAMASLAPERSLAQDAALAASLQRLGQPRDFFAYAPATSSIVRSRGLPGVALVGSLDSSAFTLRADAPWPNTRGSLQVLDKREGPDLSNVLPSDAFLVARFQGDPALLGPYWPHLVGSFIAQAVNSSGFDLQTEVLNNLLPGEVLGVAVAPTAKLGGGVPELDVRRTNPFQFIQLVAAAKAKDAQRAQATLAKLPPVAERFGAHVTPAQRNGKPVFMTTYLQGEGVHFALVGDTLVVAAPAAQLDAALGRAASPPHAGPLPDPALRKALDGRAVSAVIDLHQLAESVKALPSTAWGLGGFAIKATTVRWLDATDDLRAVTLGLSEKEGAIEAELSLRLVSK
ncbi:MAG TPA: hypothetical protein VH208_04770 [Myxococcaceae bacterium]|nr:hypothetical protein [Myxococcaceae bacterium]